MFQDCNSETEVKKLYRRLALLIHPDRGGDGELMVKLTKAYDRALSNAPKPRSTTSQARTQPNPRPRKPPEPKPQPEAPRPRKDGEPYTESQEGDIKNTDWRSGILLELVEFFKTKKSYTNKFINSIACYFAIRGFITSGQYNCLVRMYNEFGLNKKS